MSRPRPRLERLDDRTLPSAAAGDFYWADGRQVALSARPDEIAVRLTAPADAAALTAPGGPLAGDRVTQTLSPTVLFVHPGPSPRPAALEQQAAVAWAAPVFTVADGGWVVATDEVVVRLRPGVSADAFFAGDPRFGAYRRLAGTPDQFIATAAAGAGRPVLALADALRADPRLLWATPNLMIGSRLTTNDPLYANQ